MLGVAFASVASVLCFVATIIDGLNSAAFRDFDICYNPGTKKIYGDGNVKNNTLPCMLNLIAGNTTASASTDCVCSTNSYDDYYECVDIVLQGDSDDCGVLLFLMPELLLASCLILLSLLIMVLFYCCLSCKSVCQNDHRILPDVPVPANATYYVVAAAEQPAPVLLSPADVTRTRAADVEDQSNGNNHHSQHNDSNTNNSNYGNSSASNFAYGGTVTATPITAYPVKM